MSVNIYNPSTGNLDPIAGVPYDILGTKTNKEDLSGIITTGSTNSTGTTITAGTYFYLNGSLVKAKTDIANGASYTLNTNYETVTIGGELSNVEAISNKCEGRFFTIVGTWLHTIPLHHSGDGRGAYLVYSDSWLGYNGMWVIVVTSEPDTSNAYITQLQGGTRTSGKNPTVTRSGDNLTLDWSNVMEGYPGVRSIHYVDLSMF